MSGALALARRPLWVKGSVAAPLVPAVVAIAVLVPAAGAQAAKRIEAGTRDRYVTTQVTIDQGERVTFFNGDLSGDRHDVTADKEDAGGKPLFSTPIIGTTEEVVVAGTQSLTTGSYAFYCSVHSYMKGKLDVTSNGAPLPGPGTPPSDQVPPDLTVVLRRGSLERVVRKRRLVVRAKLDEPAKLTLRATTKRRGRTVTIAKRTLRFSAAGTRDVVLRLGRRGRALLGKRERARIKLRGRATDAAGNADSERSARTYR